MSAATRQKASNTNMATASPTQAFVPVKEVRNGVVILKNGEYRGILMCSSTNFGLKSPDEQRGIVEGFQNFLNTLDFSVQIVVHSRKMDIRPYLELLAEREGVQQTELMKIQVREYMQFIGRIAEGANIMTKTFYIVVPYTASGVSQVKSALPFFGNTAATPEGVGEAFEEHRIQLEERMALVQSGIASSGLSAAQLGTEEVLELLYHSFNVGQLESAPRNN
jgi:hypothetical protein